MEMDLPIGELRLKLKHVVQQNSKFICLNFKPKLQDSQRGGGTGGQGGLTDHFCPEAF